MKMSKQVLAKIGSTLVQWVVCGAIVYAVWRWLLAPHLSPVFFSGPAPVWDELWAWGSNGTMWSITRFTLIESGVGFGIGTALGVTVALAIALLPSVVGQLVEPLVTALYAMPKFVLIPVLFVWMGAGLTPRVVIVAAAVFPIMTIYTITGVRTVDPNRVQALSMLGASRRQIALKLLLPHSLGYVITGITFAAPHAVFLAIGAEILFGTPDGIGGLLNAQAEIFNAPDVLAALVVATALSIVLMAVVRQLGLLFTGPEGLRGRQ
jgi:NitT/TauT family transport system permease protein